MAKGSNKVTGNIDDIYWSLKGMTDKCIKQIKKSRIYIITGILCFISLFTLLPLGLSSLPSEDGDYKILTYLAFVGMGIFFIAFGIYKGRAKLKEESQFYEFIMGVIEAVRDDVREKGIITINIDPNPIKKNIESDTTVTEPRFHGVRRIKYKYVVGELTFRMLDGNVMKVRLIAKEREKIKRDHKTKRYVRKNYLLKVRLDVNPKVYDMKNINQDIYKNYEFTPNIVIGKINNGDRHVSMTVKLLTLDQYSGRQTATITKSLYRHIALKRFSNR